MVESEDRTSVKHQPTRKINIVFVVCLRERMCGERRGVVLWARFMELCRSKVGGYCMGNSVVKNCGIRNEALIQGTDPTW